MPRPHTERLLWQSWAQCYKNNNDDIIHEFIQRDRLPYSYWSNTCQSGTPYVIYTLYINIFQRQKQVVCCLFGLNKWETSIHLSKEYTIRRRRLLCTFSLAAKCSRKRRHILCDNRDRVCMDTSRRKRVTRGHTELGPWQRHASCTWESCF